MVSKLPFETLWTPYTPDLCNRTKLPFKPQKVIDNRTLQIIVDNKAPIKHKIDRYSVETSVNLHFAFHTDLPVRICRGILACSKLECYDQRKGFVQHEQVSIIQWMIAWTTSCWTADAVFQHLENVLPPTARVITALTRGPIDPFGGNTLKIRVRRNPYFKHNTAQQSNSVMNIIQENDQLLGMFQR